MFAGEAASTAIESFASIRGNSSCAYSNFASRIIGRRVASVPPNCIIISTILNFKPTIRDGGREFGIIGKVVVKF